MLGLGVPFDGGSHICITDMCQVYGVHQVVKDDGDGGKVIEPNDSHADEKRARALDAHDDQEGNTNQEDLTLGNVAMCAMM